MEVEFRPLARHFLPPKPQDFVGRAETLEELYAVLRKKPGGLLTVVATQAAREFESEVSERFPERFGLGQKVVAGVGFEPTIRRSPDYEPDERIKPVSLKNPSPRP